jgi:hypothetical protein
MSSTNTKKAPIYNYRSGGWVGFDLDGTLAVYDEWRGATHIGEPIMPNVKRAQRYLQDGIEVRIFTARADGGLDLEEVTNAIQDWTEKHIGRRLAVTNRKDFGMIRLYDDRAIQVEFNTGRRVDGRED